MKKSDLEKLVTSITVMLEREYIFRDFDLGTDEEVNHVASSCFVTPPAKGEYFVTDKGIYEVLTVTHVFDSARRAGVIWVKKVSDDGLNKF